MHISVTLGYQPGDQCQLDYLPVYLGKEAVYLDATGMIATELLLDQVDCKGIFTPILLTIDERLI